MGPHQDVVSTPKARRRWCTRPWAIVPAALIAVFGGLWWAVVEHHRPAAWKYAASAMGPEFQGLVLDPEPDFLSTRPRPRPAIEGFGSGIDYPWEIELDEVRVEATYADGQDLDDIERRTRAAAARLGLLDPLCARFTDERAVRRADTGPLLICNVYDTEHHPLGLVVAWDDDPITRITLTMSPDGAGRVAPGIGPKNLPDR